MASNARITCICCVFRLLTWALTFSQLATLCGSTIKKVTKIMQRDSLETFIESVSTIWAAISSELVVEVRALLAKLVATTTEEAWLAALHTEVPESRELYRDRLREFLLLAHTEAAGLYRAPHDHGRGWVAYAVQRGEMQMSTYRRMHDLRGQAYLVKRESFIVRARDVRVFLPGDIHDTRCMAGPLTLFRFTSRDLKKEEVTRYPEPSQTATPLSGGKRYESL